MNKRDFDNARKLSVTKRVDMIQNSRFNLSLIENKAVSYIISKVKPTDKPGKIYQFDCGEFYRLIQWNKESYTDLKAMLNRISDNSWWIDYNETEALVRWFNIVHMNKGTGTVQISFHDDMFPYVIGLQQQLENNSGKVFYTSFQYQSIAPMKHKHSPRIFEIVLSYQLNNQKWIFEMGTGTKHDLQVLISPTDKNGKSLVPKTWKKYAYFNKLVLMPAKEDINKYTDIKIEYEPLKIDLKGVRHNKYCAIRFFMKEKTPGEKEEVSKLMDKEYSDYIEEYEQLTMEQIFDMQHDEQLTKEEEDEKAKEEAAKEERIESSKYKILTYNCNEYSDEELEKLYIAALKHLKAGKIPITKKEYWATDLITYYNECIKETPKETKTSPYKRLLDMVKKDYDKIADKIDEYDYKDGEIIEVDITESYEEEDKETDEVIEKEESTEDNAGNTSNENLKKKPSYEEMEQQLNELKKKMNEIIERMSKGNV